MTYCPLASELVAESRLASLFNRLSQTQSVSSLSRILSCRQFPGCSAVLAQCPVLSWQLTLRMRRNWNRNVCWTKTVICPPAVGAITGYPLMVSSGLQLRSPLNYSPLIHHDNWKGLWPFEACFCCSWLHLLTEMCNRAGCLDSLS